MKQIAIITMGLALAMPLQAEEAKDKEAPKKPTPFSPSQTGSPVYSPP